MADLSEPEWAEAMVLAWVEASANASEEMLEAEMVAQSEVAMVALSEPEWAEATGAAWVEA